MSPSCTLRTPVRTPVRITVIRIVKNCPENQILSKNISWVSILPSLVIEVLFSVKIAIFSIFIILTSFGLFQLIIYKKNLAFSDQYEHYLNQPNLSKTLVLHIRKNLPNKINMNFGPPMSTCANSDFFLKLFTKQNCQI